jgi:hypothetical protein
MNAKYEFTNGLVVKSEKSSVPGKVTIKAWDSKKYTERQVLEQVKKGERDLHYTYIANEVPFEIDDIDDVYTFKNWVLDRIVLDTSYKFRFEAIGKLAEEAIEQVEEEYEEGLESEGLDLEDII